jgi:hypothetical protein
MSETVFTKQEFTRQLFQLIVSGVYEGIDSIYKASESLCELHKQPTKVLMTFQNLLSAIPKWINDENKEKLEKECRRILDKSNCEDYIDELLNAVFIAYVKSITSVRNTTNTIRVSFEAPTFETFLYRVYVYSAREFWKNPTIFRRGKSSEENQKSMTVAQTIIEQAIVDVIRNSIPLKKILKECFNEELEEATVSGLQAKVSTSIPEPIKETNETKEETKIEVPSIKEEPKPPQESDIKPITFSLAKASMIDTESDKESDVDSEEVKYINLKDEPKKVQPVAVERVEPKPEVKAEPKPEPKKLGFLLPDDLESVTSEIFGADDDAKSDITYEELGEMKFTTDSEPFEFEIHPDDASGDIKIKK